MLRDYQLILNNRGTYLIGHRLRHRVHRASQQQQQQNILCSYATAKPYTKQQQNVHYILQISNIFHSYIQQPDRAYIPFHSHSIVFRALTLIKTFLCDIRRLIQKRGLEYQTLENKHSTSLNTIKKSRIKREQIQPI